MHMQKAIPGWTDALIKMPDGALVKGFDMGLMSDARAKWAAAGRDQSKLHTLYRHFDFAYPFDRPLTFDEHRAIWRDNFARFIGKTNLALHMRDVSAIETLNEHTDERMILDKELLRPHLLTEQAAVAVWNDEYRGRTVHTTQSGTEGGGEGFISADMRLVICNGPVGNSIPRELMQLAIDSDNLLGYHPYTFWLGSRQPGDWVFYSGRWNRNEQDYGLRPRWAFTECGPFRDAGSGWRSQGVCNGDVSLLVDAHRQVARDMHQTAAFREGRIFGWPGAWFTSGGGAAWDGYELDTPALSALADMYRTEFTPEGPLEADMEANTLKTLTGQAQSIIDTAGAMLSTLKTLTPTHSMAGLTNQQVINLFRTCFGISYFDVLTRAGQAGTVDHRGNFYTGPAIEALPLSDAEKAKLLSGLPTA